MSFSSLHSRPRCPVASGRRRWPGLFGIPLLLALLLVAGCGESSKSSSSSSSSSGSASSSADVSGAQAEVATASQAPTSLGISEKITKPIAAGKTVYFLNCGSVSCSTAASTIAEAAKVLGWNVKQLKMGFSPEGVKSAFTTAIREKPSAIVEWGVPSVLFGPELAELKANKIPLITSATGGGSVPGIVYTDNEGPESVPVGKIMADDVIASSKGNANVVFLNLPAAPILAAYEKGFKEELSARCTSCKFAQLAIAEADLGTGGQATKTVGYLRSHPETNYVVPSYDELIAGVPAALSSAGLSAKVKIVGENPTPQTNVYLKNGEQEASVSWPVHETAWKDVDVLARYFNGESLKPDGTPLPRQLITGKDLKVTNNWYDAVPNYQEQFKTLWGK
jgi:ABC-type sugar transport system substrate-binding protein